MAYVVNTTAHAEQDLADLYRQINAGFSTPALEWYLGIKAAILSLERSPKRCPITRKRGWLRHLLYGHKPYVYRVIYRVVEKQKRVEVLHIRYGGRRKIKPSDLV